MPKNREGMGERMSEISKGVAGIVEELNALGYDTADSGDGSNYADGMPCTLPFRHVFGVFSDEQTDLREHGNRLKDLYPEAYIEISYVPGDVAVFAIYPDGTK